MDTHLPSEVKASVRYHYTWGLSYLDRVEVKYEDRTVRPEPLGMGWREMKFNHKKSCDTYPIQNKEMFGIGNALELKNKDALKLYLRYFI